MKIVKKLNQGGFILEDQNGNEFQLRSLYNELESVPIAVDYLRNLELGETINWVQPTNDRVNWWIGNIFFERDRFWANWDIILLEKEIENYSSNLYLPELNENAFTISNILANYQFEVHKESSIKFLTPTMEFFINIPPENENKNKIEQYFKSLKIGDKIYWCEKLNEEVIYDNQFNNEVLAFTKEESEKILGVDITELEESIDNFYSN